MSEKTYSSFEIIRFLNISKEKFRDWLNNGFIKPSMPSEGRGKAAGFTTKDVYGVGLFRELINYGIPREKAALMVKFYYDKYFTNADISMNKSVEPTGEHKASISTVVGDHQGYVDFIVFCKVTAKDGTELTKAFGVTNDSWRISLKSGKAVGDKVSSEVEPQGSWDSLLIINYRKIRDEIDRALAKA